MSLLLVPLNYKKGQGKHAQWNEGAIHLNYLSPVIDITSAIPQHQEHHGLNDQEYPVNTWRPDCWENGSWQNVPPKCSCQFELEGRAWSRYFGANQLAIEQLIRLKVILYP